MATYLSVARPLRLGLAITKSFCRLMGGDVT
jgi:hypothetical protein